MANRTNNLTPKQQRFCRAVASGCTLSDAYRKAYDADKMKPATINREATRLVANPTITTRIEAMQRAKDRAAIACSLSDRERVLTTLRDLLDNATGTAGEMARLRAADLLGKSVGLYRDVTESVQQRSAEEIQAELDALLSGTEQDKSAVH